MNALCNTLPRQSAQLALAVLVMAAPFSALSPASADDAAEMIACFAETIQSAPDQMTVGQIKEACRVKLSNPEQQFAQTENEEGAVKKRIRMDKENTLKPFTLMAHRQNYILLAANNFDGYSSEEFEDAYNRNEIDLDDVEAQFQLSIKTPLAIDLFTEGLSLWSAYTVRSFWQVYNHDISSPFRETNHEPEAWLQYVPDIEFLGFTTTAAALGIVHQSNGQAGTLSRSWNRIYGAVVFEKGNWVVSIKPWFRIQEDAEDDDNPDITDYLGHGEFHLAYKHEDHVFTLMSRNNLESGFSKGAIQLGWSFPLWEFPYLKGYVQYFSGYGESLIDYDEYVNRLGFGLLLTDLL